MSFLDKIERKGLFSLTRWLAFVIVGLLALTVCFAALFFVKTWTVSDNAHISPKEVINELSAKKSNAVLAQDDVVSAKENDALQGLKIPPILLDMMDDPSNRRFIRANLVDIKPDNRQSFLNDMADTVLKAQESKISEADAANTYVVMYRAHQREIDESVAQAKTQRLFSLGVFTTGLFLLALFSLVLVLLAIERNTRKVIE